VTRILVTGAAGMLGSTIVERWHQRHEIFATARTPFEAKGWAFRAFDLSDPDHAPLISWARPEVIVHCAAWTALDACEQDPERTLAINGRSVERLLAAAPNARMIFISSDAVLGDRAAPLGEDAPPHPLNAYGRSKHLGEELLAARGAGVAVRTTVVGWNVDPRKQSFVEWIVRALERDKEITLFRDAWFNPIAAPLLADELEPMLTDGRTGVWHVSAHDSTSKLDFGIRLAARLGLSPQRILEGSIDAMRFVARRSADQRLAVARYEAAIGRALPSLDAVIDELVRDRARIEKRAA
jgi:dTDP-4-dehydrorhamnose reductase